MKIWQALTAAFSGWIAIVRGEADWKRHFSLSAAGLVTALALFLFFTLLFIAIASGGLGMFDFFFVFSALVVQSLPVLALLLSIYITRKIVPNGPPVLTLLVPGIYALIAYLIVGTVLALMAGPLLMLLWAGLAALFFCLGWRAGGWNIGVAAAFAVLTMVLLVGMPLTLYMVLGPLAAPTP